MILHVDSTTGNLVIDENTDHYPYIYLGTFITELFACKVSKSQIRPRGPINKKSYAELMPNLGQTLDIRKT